MKLGIALRALLLTLVITLVHQQSALGHIWCCHNYWEWSPAEGYLHVHAPGGQRYAFSDFYWGTAGRHSALEWGVDGTSAYEHEVIFYNYSRLAYATGGAFYASNLPTTNYLDPQLFDNQDEVTVEVGTTRADNITDGVWYYADVRLVHNASSSGSSTKLRTVRGQRAHSCAYDWCVAEVEGRIIVQQGQVWWYWAWNSASQTYWLDP